MKKMYAGFWKRFAALVIDDIILVAVVLIIWLINYLATGNTKISLGTNDPVQTIIGIVVILLFILYFSIMESSSKQATLGKMVLKIKVTDYSGKRISFLRALGRYLAKIISEIILYIGFMMAGWTKKKQALHDKIASTLVVNDQPRKKSRGKNSKKRRK